MSGLSTPVHPLSTPKNGYGWTPQPSPHKDLQSPVHPFHTFLG